jgi:diketogulonate reductase-like aldo/keto reductase
VGIDRSISKVALRGGNSMPIIGFGTWQIQGELARQAVLCALQVGYRHLDTAAVYGNEPEVGRALAESGIDRDDVFLTTKVPPDTKQARRTLEQSLSALQLDHIDLWLIHWPPRRSDSVPLYKEMLELRDEGLVRSIGVSNFTVDQIDALSASTGETPEVNQIPWSPFLHDSAEERELRRRDVTLEGYSPLQKSALHHPVLVEIAAALEVSPARVVLRWHIQHEIVVIPKSVHPDRIQENFDVFSFSLDPDSMRRLDELSPR